MRRVARGGVTRRRLLGGAAGLAPPWPASSRAEDAPSAPPMVLQVMDAAGALRQTQPAFEAYCQTKPGLVSRVVFSQAPAAKLPGRLAAQEEAGKAGFDLVLAGPALLSAGIDRGLWTPLLPYHAGRLPNLKEILLPAAWIMQEFARGQGVVVSYCPSGPLLGYLPDQVKPVPATADELLAWARAHPKRFVYANPVRSEAGRAFLMGLPYLLGDGNPKDPERGWDKTWAYLRELGTTIEHYPAGNPAALAGLRDGTRSMIATTTAQDMAHRVRGDLPGKVQVAALEGFHWVADAHYAAIPQGLSDARKAVLLDLIGFLLTREAQAFAYELGIFYPGPAVSGITLAMAPVRIQDQIRAAERPQYEGLIAGNPAEAPLDGGKLAYALRRWEEQVSAVTAG